MTNFLLPVQPISFGTVETESLSSFYSRVAILHGYGHSQLLRALRGAFEPHSSHDGESRLYTGNGLNGTGLWVQRAADLLGEGLGRSDLSGLTLLALHSDECRGDQASGMRIRKIRRSRRWCEMCFNADSDSGVDPHDRLLWTCSYIQRCPFHRVCLRSKCPSCNQPQTYHNMKLGLAHCYHCDSTLVGGSHAIQPDMTTHYGEKECMDLVAAIASGEVSKIEKDTVVRFYQALTELRAPMHRADRRTLMRNHIRKQGASGVSLSTLIDVSIAYQVPIVRLVTQPEFAAKVFLTLTLSEHRDSLPFGGRDYDSVLDEIRSLMTKGLSSHISQRIPTLAEIAKHFQLKDFSFQDHFPELSRQYKFRVRSQGQKRLGQTSAARFVRILHSDGKLSYLTDGEIKSMLADELGAPPNSVKVQMYAVRRLRRAPQV